MSNDRRSTVEHNRKVQANRDEWTRQQEIRDAIESCSRALERAGDIAGPDGEEWYRLVDEQCRSVLAPLLRRHVGCDLLDYDVAVDGVNREALDALTSTRTPGVAPGKPGSRQTIVDAFHSLSAIAEDAGVIEGDLRNKADATGFAIKLGEHNQRWEMDFGDDVTAITRRLGALKSFYTGGTGSGKSAGAARQMEDYYRASRSSQYRDYKIFDPVGLSAENVCAYDVPQQHDTLRRARERHGLSADWTEIDDYEPECEILVPLAPAIDDYKLPYDVDADEFVPRPFTIPASDLSEGLFVALIDARVSDGQKRIIREAYSELDRDADDWSLDDLKYSIQSRDELSTKDTEAATKVIENLKGAGFIRTRNHPHTLNWDDVFTSTDVVTVVNQTPLDSELHRLIVIAYLLDMVWQLRIRSHGYPNLAMWLRELWEIAPHAVHRSKGDDAEKNVKEHIIGTLTKIMRKPRDINTHIVADTQDASDPERAIRTRFNRFVLFGGNDSTLEDVFSWAEQNGWRKFKETLTGRPGHAGIIGACEPAVGDPKKWGVSPVHLTPPSWHHHDKDQGPSGWQKRVHYSHQVDAMPTQELRYIGDEWDTAPVEDEELLVTDRSTSENSVETMSQKERAKLKARQMRALTNKAIPDIAEEIPNNPDTDKSFSERTVTTWVRDIDKGSGEVVVTSD